MHVQLVGPHVPGNRPTASGKGTKRARKSQQHWGVQTLQDPDCIRWIDVRKFSGASYCLSAIEQWCQDRSNDGDSVQKKPGGTGPLILVVLARQQLHAMGIPATPWWWLFPLVRQVMSCGEIPLASWPAIPGESLW